MLTKSRDSVRSPDFCFYIDLIASILILILCVHLRKLHFLIKCIRLLPCPLRARRHIKQVFVALARITVVDYARHTAVNFVALINILAQIAAVAQNALKAVFVELAAFGGRNAPPVQIADKLGVIVPRDKHFKNRLDDGRKLLVKHKIFLAVYLVTERNNAAEILALCRRHCNTALNLLRKLRAVIFRHTLFCDSSAL